MREPCKHLTVPGYSTRIDASGIIFEDTDREIHVEWRICESRLVDLMAQLDPDARQALGIDAEGGNLLNIHIQEALTEAEPGVSYLEKTDFGFAVRKISS